MRTRCATVLAGVRTRVDAPGQPHQARELAPWTTSDPKERCAPVPEPAAPRCSCVRIKIGDAQPIVAIADRPTATDPDIFDKPRHLGRLNWRPRTHRRGAPPSQSPLRRVASGARACASKSVMRSRSSPIADRPSAIDPDIFDKPRHLGRLNRRPRTQRRGAPPSQSPLRRGASGARACASKSVMRSGDRRRSANGPDIFDKPTQPPL